MRQESVVREFLRPVDAVHPPPATPSDARYIRSYLILRTVIGVLGIVLPFALVFVDYVWLGGDTVLRTSLSDYYYSGAREWFVGGLSAIGVFLLTYKVAEANLDNTLSLLGGLTVLVVALFPTSRPNDLVRLTPLQDHLGENLVAGIHFSSAAVFIASLAFISYFFGMREGARPRREGRRSPRFWQTFHWICAGTIAVALA
jgi:Ni,Fe-hydrogenase I cytochrome b subunit